MPQHCVSMSDKPQTERRVALVTGATRGIGREIAVGLAGRGFAVVATGRDATLGEEVARALGPASAFHPLDVTEEAAHTRIARLLETGYGGLDVLVDNAGASFDGFDAQVARRTLDVNFFGAMRLTDRLLPLLRPHARIVMVSSGMGEVACLGAALRAEVMAPTLDRAGLAAFVERFIADVGAGSHAARGWPSNAYRVSKVALNAYTRVLARELEGDPRRVLVNAACPGWVRTDMGGPGAPRTPAEGARTPLWLATLPEGGPTGGFFRDEAPIPW